jgi:galactokinase
MGATRIPKVCLPVAGVPAVNRTLRAFRECGVRTNVVVVGSDAGEVVRIVGSEFPDAMFVLQREPLGTGDAVAKGARPLLAAGFQGLVFVGVGDKVLDASAVRTVLEAFRRSHADVALAVTSRPKSVDMGRLVLDEKGRPLGGVEALEFRLARLYERLRRPARAGLETKALRWLCRETLGGEKHLKRLGKLSKAIETQRRISYAQLLDLLPENAGIVRIGKKSLSLKQALSGPPYMNESLYLLTPSALARGLALLARRKREGESYFTDVIHLLAQDQPRGVPRGYVIEPVVLDHRSQLIFGFNTPGQLMELEDLVRRREGRARRVSERRPSLGRRVFKSVGEWLSLYRSRSPAILRALRQTYGADSERCEAKRAEYLALLKLFARRFGRDRSVVITRAPGSLNLMGRHIDTEGGFINVMTIDREAIFIAAARRDDCIRLCAGSPSFNDTEFTIGGELAALDWDDWVQYVSSAKVRQMVARSRDERSNYVKAAVLRLQHKFQDIRLAGMDCVASCNIPSAAGLGASGAIVAAAIEGMAALNGLRLRAEEVMRLCAEGQWYVTPSSTGGEHVASRLGVNRVAHVRFHPLEIETVVPFPEDWRVLLCDAGERGRQGSDFRNKQIATMHLGIMLLRLRYPRLAHLIERIRDLDPERLGIRLSELYTMLGALPERISPGAVMRLFPQAHGEEVRQVLATHEAPREYAVRELTFFGAAECARSRLFPSLLEKRKARLIGGLMAVSHEAERARPARPPAAKSAAGGEARGWSACDALVQRLIADLSSEDPERMLRAQLYMQPGRYGSSTAVLDDIVDAVTAVPGVIGAQLSGTGQGGCAMVIAQAPAVTAVRDRVARLCDGRGITVALSPAVSVPGSGLLST